MGLVKTALKVQLQQMTDDDSLTDVNSALAGALTATLVFGATLAGGVLKEVKPLHIIRDKIIKRLL